MKRLFYSIAVMVLALSCGKDPQGGETPGDNTTPGTGENGGITEVVTIQSNISIDLKTDKAIYKPGETVRFTADNMPSDAKIRYRCMGETVHEQDAAGNEWTWTKPSADGRGYMVEIYREKDEKTDLILGTIGVDVSSDWSMFPRYGFVGDFGKNKLTEGVIEEEMAFLNRCHINGVQFYDWHNKHHWPLGGTMEKLDEVYKDIANRDVYNAAVKKYIDVQHSYGMKAMFYNHAIGVLDDAKADGVKEEWNIYKQSNRGDQDAHTLPASWKSSIYLVDPGNTEWQAYIVERNKEVYHHLDFDGFHIDQLGSRGTRYDWNSRQVDLPSGYASFINAMKKAHPDKRLVFNAVSSYGANKIVGTGNVDFCYNEVWGSEAQFKDLYTIIKSNDLSSDHSLKSIFAAYMNYECSNREFNIPGVLLTDAVMFALGGAHLELGDHMLCREYFPSQEVKMSSALKTSIVRYYDFMTAYENLLRGASSKAEVQVEVTSEASRKISFNNWPPKEGGVTTYAKKIEGKTVIHFLNFRSVDNLSWRDLKGTRPAPTKVMKSPVKIKVNGKVNRVWSASPDQHAGALQELAFTQEGGYISFVLPSLEYWTMLVIE
jgi:dextranase